jgi:hypothetical protein
MALCSALTQKGKPCANPSKQLSRFCESHEGYESPAQFQIVGIGLLLGHLAFPGFGGMLAGGAGAYFFNKLFEDNTMTKKRVFVSFDFDNDKKLKDFIIGQSKLSDSPFAVIDHSLKEAAPENNWKTKARAAIKRSEVVVVMVGPKTSKAQGVLAEVAMAREEGVPIVQVIGYKDGEYTAVPNAGRLYRWNWDNLKKLLG